MSGLFVFVTLRARNSFFSQGRWEGRTGDSARLRVAGARGAGQGRASTRLARSSSHARAGHGGHVSAGGTRSAGSARALLSAAACLPAGTHARTVPSPMPCSPRSNSSIRRKERGTTTPAIAAAPQPSSLAAGVAVIQGKKHHRKRKEKKRKKRWTAPTARGRPGGWCWRAARAVHAPSWPGRSPAAWCRPRWWLWWWSDPGAHGRRDDHQPYGQ